MVAARYTVRIVSARLLKLLPFKGRSNGVVLLLKVSSQFRKSMDRLITRSAEIEEYTTLGRTVDGGYFDERQIDSSVSCRVCVVKRHR
jgi:hypothetical protein